MEEIRELLETKQYTRLRQKLSELNDADILVNARKIAENGTKAYNTQVLKQDIEAEQISLFDTVNDSDILKELESIDIGNMTPVDALNALYRLQNKIKNRW